jgi:ElaB protein
MQSRAQTSPVGRDVQNVVSEAQELLKTVKDEGATRLEDVKSKVASQYDAAREKFGEIQSTVQDGAKAAMTTTDEYVRGNPWRAVGIAAAAGAIIGFLASRR